MNSMSDLFHEEIPFDYIARIFKIMNQAWWHVFQILTKRSERLSFVSEKLNWSRNIWMGVSVENERYLHRIAHLQTVPASVRFLSLEPLLGPIPNLPLDGIDWVIAGGESGPRSRPVKAEWLRGVRDDCIENKTPFFFKQWGGVWKSRQGRQLDGQIWNEFPRFDDANITKHP